MDYALATFDGAHFAHVAAWHEHRRLARLTTLALHSIRDARSHDGVRLG